MTGAFELAVSIFATVDFGLKLYDRLSAFVSKVKYADRTAEDLAQKVESLHNNLYAVYRTLKKRKEQLKGKEPETEEEKWVWVNISQTFRSWRRTLRQFKKEVDELDAGPEGRRRTWIGKTLWCLKNDQAVSILQGFQSDITHHNMELWMMFQCLNA